MTERKPMEPTSRKNPPALQPAADTQLPAGNRITSGSLVRGSPSWIERHELISQLAYYKAQQRGFAPGHDWEDWFAAEREVTESR